MIFAARTDVGRVRTNNEDAFGTFPEAGVFCVADGMGGAMDGEVASGAIMAEFERSLLPWKSLVPPLQQEDRLSLLREAADRASAWVFDRAARTNAKGCGSTLVLICLDPARPGTAAALHAGDSRLYRLHRRRLEQITRDHSPSAFAGVSDEADLGPMFRNLVLRAVGVRPTVELERTDFSLAEGDRLLLCSDGVSRAVPQPELLRILRAAETPDRAAEDLVAAANGHGGADNATALVAFCDNLPPPAPVRALLSAGERAALLAGTLAAACDETTTTSVLPDDTTCTAP